MVRDGLFEGGVWMRGEGGCVRRRGIWILFLVSAVGVMEVSRRCVLDVNGECGWSWRDRVGVYLLRRKFKGWVLIGGHLEMLYEML